MPFSWKKSTKSSSRISRFVADLQAPKRGGSLVVETGFPTSIVDLFVKNRDRLRKSSKKKSPLSKSYPPPMEISNPVLVSPPSIKYNNRILNSPMKNETTKENEVEEFEECVCDLTRGGGGGSNGGVDRRSNNRKKESVLVAVLKMFLVVVLALSTKRLAVGISMSAFLLLFIEYVGTRFLLFLEPCFSIFNSKKKNIERFEEKQEDSRKPALVVTDVCGLVDIKERNEIQVAESNLDIVDPVAVEEIARNEPEGCDILPNKNEKSRSARLKSKLVKKLVPKKLRSKKAKKCKGKEMEMEIDSSSCSEDSSCTGDDKSRRSDDVESFEEEERSCKGQEITSTKSEGNSGYLIMCLIVLAGLIGGRLLSLVITVSLCAIYKLVARLRRHGTETDLKKTI